ncbi:MAG: hypothetical protein EBQ71_09645, partial [Betaproteobacteria bacterium]|nr:hypothetical protein [Betaproteobacteria bacterium]
FRAKIVQVPSDGYFNEIWMKRPVSMTRWNQRPADAALNEIYRGGATWNESFYKDAKFDVMLDEARKELNFDKRKAKYQQAQEYLWETSGTLVGFHATLTVATTAASKTWMLWRTSPSVGTASRLTERLLCRAGLAAGANNPLPPQRLRAAAHLPEV